MWGVGEQLVDGLVYREVAEAPLNFKRSCIW